MYYFYMVQIESNSENKSFRILLSPNRSLSWKSTCIFLLFISITCLTIGIGFSLVGAQLIIPFAGLEVILVSVCVYLVFRKTSSEEEKLQLVRHLEKIIYSYR